MNNLKKGGELQGRGIVYILRRALIIPEKRVVYACGLPGLPQRRYDTRASIRLIASAITLSMGG